MAPAPTLPATPPPTQYRFIRTTASRSGTAPNWRTRPSCWRSNGPKWTVPVCASSMKWRSSGPLPANESTGVHSCQPSSELTSRTAGARPPSTGDRESENRCPATPSAYPSTSLSTISACSASTVPPTVHAVSVSTIGDELNLGWFSSGSTARTRNQPARTPSTVDAAWSGGMCTTTLPGRLSPPVSSVLTSQETHSWPCHASHTRGGHNGSTPTPWIGPRNSTRTAHRGTGSDRPRYSASSGRGVSLNTPKLRAIRTSSVWSTVSASGSPVPVRMAVSEHGTIARSSMVAKTSDSVVSVRSVAALVPAGTVNSAVAGAESQNVTGAVAGTGGINRNPMRSRNFRYSRSGTRFSRNSIWSVMYANVSMSVIPGSDTLWSVHSGHWRITIRLASSTRSWKRRSSRSGAGSAISSRSRLPGWCRTGTPGCAGRWCPWCGTGCRCTSGSGLSGR